MHEAPPALAGRGVFGREDVLDRFDPCLADLGMPAP